MIRKGLLSVVGLILIAAPAAFATIILDTSGLVSYQQTTNSPCVIGNPSCKNSGFAYTSAPTAPDWSQVLGVETKGQYDVFSPNGVYALGSNLKSDPANYVTPYLVDTSQSGVTAPNTIPGTFTIGIDVNYNKIREDLVEFNTWVYDGSGPTTLKSNWVLDTNNSWNFGDASHPSPVLLEVHNGNGWSDAILTGFNLSNGSLVFFEAIYGAAYDGKKPVLGSDEDGMEQFFIVTPGTPTIPEPGTLFLLGAGLIGLAAVSKRRKK